MKKNKSDVNEKHSLNDVLIEKKMFEQYTEKELTQFELSNFSIPSDYRNF